MTVRSIFTGLTGVSAMGRGIDVIGNNIANVNTVGFRASRATFDDIYSQTLFAGVGPQGNIGGINPRQLGTGVSMGSVDLIFTQGNVQSTGRLLDLAIQGEGMFVMRDSNARQILTRAGNFTLDADGMIVDPGTGNRLLGRLANSEGQIDTTNPISDMRIDYNINIPARQSTFVGSGGNLNSDSPPEAAKTSNNLRGLFNRYGESMGLVIGDVVRFETGFVDVANPPDTLAEPIDLANFDFGNGEGVLLTVTADTTVEDLRKTLDDALDATIEQSIQGAQSGFDVQYDSDSGRFVFRTQNDALRGIRIGLAPHVGDTQPPTNSARLGEVFVTRDDPNFTRTLDVSANNTIRTESLRQANTTSSIEVFDSQGNSRTLTLGFAKDTRPTEAIGSTTLNELRDRDGRAIIEGGFPPQITFADPVIDQTNNTAIFTASQVDNIVATQGVISFMAGDGSTAGGNTMLSLRMSDAAVSFNGGTFYLPGQTTDDNTPTGTALDVRTTALLQALDVSTNERLNIGGGLMGDAGFEEGTTLENIRNQVESKFNSALAGLITALQQLSDPASTVFADAIAANELNGLVGVAANIPLAGASIGVPTTSPQTSIQLSDEGSLNWSFQGGSIGAAIDSVPANPQLDDARKLALETSAGGADKLALQLDLAARTRSIRVSTAREAVLNSGNLAPDNAVDDVIAGGVTAFTATPFDTNDLALAFTVGDTDYGGARGGTAVDNQGNLLNNDPTNTRPFEQTLPLPVPPHDPRDTDLTDANNPTGVFDSGVQLIALTDGIYSNDMSRQNADETAGLFGGEKAFDPIANAFNAIFNPRGYGIARDNGGATTLDRLDSTSNSGDVPNGIVVTADAVGAFETNTLHTTGVRNNSWGYQAVVPNDKSDVPLGYLGFIDFTSEGLFNSYGGSDDKPTVNFDPDGEDPVNGGVSPLSFQLDLSSMTQYGQARTTATLLAQDGRAVGTLDSLSIAPDGQILGIFTNGATRALGQVVLARVTNPGGLTQLGDTTFVESPNSGPPVVFNPGDGGTGVITSGQLELSNVDLANEFTSLIVTQRAFQASSRVITTADQILQETVNLVR